MVLCRIQMRKLLPFQSHNSLESLLTPNHVAEDEGEEEEERTQEWDVFPIYWSLLDCLGLSTYNRLCRRRLKYE